MAQCPRALLLSSFLVVTALLSGCGIGVVSGPSAVPGAALKGAVHGGQNPVSGAQVYLLAANTTGYGSASISELNASSNTTADTNGHYYVTTDAGGNFSITGDYSCTTGTQVYLYAVGGDPGSGTNSAVGLMEALGDCGSLPSVGSVIINEVTTVATAFALAGYSTDATHVSSSGTPLALTGVANAFANVNNLVSVAGGYAYTTTPAGNGTVPQLYLNTLGNILAACVNSSDNEDGGGNFVSYSSNCSTLFANATNSGTANTGTRPTDTASAVINIAHFPGSNTATLSGLPTGNPPFGPSIPVNDVPIDFILGIKYTSASLNNPAGIAIDASGNAWITNYSGNTVTELSSLGAPVDGEPTTGYSDASINVPTGIAIDATGHVWVADSGGSGVTKLTGTGQSLTASGVDLGLGTPSGATAVAVDPIGNVWVTSPTTGSAGNVVEIAASNAAVSTYSPTGLAGPTGIASDVSGDIWVTNAGQSSILELNSAGTLVSGETAAGFTGGGLYNPVSVAIDPAGNVWVTDPSTANAVTEFTSAGAVPNSETSSGFTGGGLNNPEGIAIDGAGNIWVADEFSSKNVTELKNAGALVTGENSTEGYVSTNLTFPNDIAVDGSGNVWVTNGVTSGTSNSVTELIGVASPVVTPIAASLIAPYSAAASLP